MPRKMPRWVTAPGIDEASFAGAVLTQVVFVAAWWYGTGDASAPTAATSGT